MSSRFEFLQTRLANLSIIRRRPFVDDRGSFARFFCTEEYKEIGLFKSVVQVNHSITCRKGAVRGLHFQYAPHAETKIVSCIKGRVFDVAVDLRPDSSTFMCWHGEVLSAENLKSLYIPEGFAHGFQTLEEDSQLLYFHTEYYVAKAEGALHVSDPCLGIDWPLPITELSERDSAHPFIDKGFAGVCL